MITADNLSETEKYQHFIGKKQEIIDSLIKRNKSNQREMLVNSATGIIILSALANIIFSAHKPNPEIPTIISSISALFVYCPEPLSTLTFLLLPFIFCLSSSSESDAADGHAE